MARKSHASLWFKGDKLEEFLFPTAESDKLKIGMSRAAALTLVEEMGWEHPLEVTTATGSLVTVVREAERAVATAI